MADLAAQENNMELSDTEYQGLVAETQVSMPLSFLRSVVNGLQIGFENTEEIFIENGARTTRSERQKALRLEDDMRRIANLITELNTFF